MFTCALTLLHVQLSGDGHFNTFLQNSHRFRNVGLGIGLGPLESPGFELSGMTTFLVGFDNSLGAFESWGTLAEENSSVDVRVRSIEAKTNVNRSW